MAHLSRRTVMQSLFAASISLAAPNAHAAARWQKSAFASLKTIASERVKSGQAVGISLGISAPGLRKMAHIGVADLKSGTPISPATHDRIASVTKPITAAAILDLCERGELSLEDTLDRFFAGFPRSTKISIYHLLAHTSGLANWWGRLPADVPDDFMDRPDPHMALARMQDPFLFEPGSMRSYSNSGYVLLGEIIESLTETPYDAWVTSALLSRCGARGIELERTGMAAPNRATGYVTNTDTDAAIGTPMPFSAGGLRSTLHDILAFSDALFHGKLLAPSSLKAMTAQARVSDGRLVQDAMYDRPEAPAEAWPDHVTEFGYGLGINTWVQSGERFYSHAGLIDGFSAYLIHAPRTLTSVAVLSNSQGGTIGIGQAIRDLMIEA